MKKFLYNIQAADGVGYVSLPILLFGSTTRYCDFDIKKHLTFSGAEQVEGWKDKVLFRAALRLKCDNIKKNSCMELINHFKDRIDYNIDIFDAWLISTIVDFPYFIATPFFFDPPLRVSPIQRLL